MHEYLLYHQNTWWHFFIKPFYGLCYRKKEGSRYTGFEVLLQSAAEDFYATVADDRILLVCQNQSGSILYLSLDGDTWHKTVLLESRSGKAYPKHFRLLPIGGFVNLFYTIAYHDKQMLVHQLITAEDKPPTVLDKILSAVPPFLVVPKSGTDSSVIYTAESGISGKRLYRWSQKHFGKFTAVHPQAEVQICAACAERDGRVRYLGFKTVESVVTLQYFEQTAEGSYTAPVTLYLDCPPTAEPVFIRTDDRLYVVWQEKGMVMSVSSRDDGIGWSHPVRYTRPTGTEPVLYTVCCAGRIQQYYGYNHGESIDFYVSALPKAEVPKRVAAEPQLRPEGYEAEQFAIENGMNPEAAPTAPTLLEQHLREELAALKAQFFSLRQLVAELSARIERLETERIPLAAEDTVDEVLLAPRRTLEEHIEK